MIFSPQVAMPGQWFIRYYRILLSHLVFQDVFDEGITVVLIIDSHLAGSFEVIGVRFPVQGKKPFTGFVELFGIPVLAKYQ